MVKKYNETKNKKIRDNLGFYVNSSMKMIDESHLCSDKALQLIVRTNSKNLNLLLSATPKNERDSDIQQLIKKHKLKKHW